jgi:hypothetical protein
MGAASKRALGAPHWTHGSKEWSALTDEKDATLMPERARVNALQKSLYLLRS